MVEDRGPIARLVGGLRDDLGRLGARIGALGRCADGVRLRHRSYETEEGRVRLHLRTHADGTGLLMVNAAEALHLSPLEAEIAALTLDDTPRDRALVHLRTLYGNERQFALEAEYDRVSAAVQRVRRPSERCRACECGLTQPPPLSIRAQAPHKADLAVTYSCNNDCAHCYNEPERREMLEMDTDRWRQVLDRLWTIGVPYVIFTGGEATLREDLPILVRHAEDLGMICGLNTNGRRLSDRGLVERLMDAGLDHVQITLASHRPALHNRTTGADAWDETVAGIGECLDRGLHTITNTTLLQENVREVEQIVEFLHETGLRTFAMNGMIHAGCGAGNPSALGVDDLRNAIERVRERAAELEMRFIWYTVTRHCELSPMEMGVGLRFCNAAEFSICVEPGGDVLPCQSWYEPCGNILQDGWESIWEGDLFSRVRNRREEPERFYLPGECHDCDDIRLCGGGCPLERATRTEVKSP